MPEGWGPIQLRQACVKIGSGATPRGGSEVYLSAGPFALIRSQNVHNDGFRRGGLAFIDERHAAELDNVDVHAGDILLNITGDSVARVCQAPPHVLPARVNQHVAIVRPDPSRLDPRFLRYSLVSPSMQSRLLSWAGSGGTRSALTKAMIESLEIPAPTAIDEQRAIGNHLGALDDKIEAGRRACHQLEAVACALFQSWFADFDPVRARVLGDDPGLPQEVAALFPDTLINSELGECPAGWGVAPVSDLVEHLRDQVDPLLWPTTPFRHFSIPAYDEGKWPTEEYGSSIRSQKSRVPKGVILLSKLNPEIERVWLVDVEPDDQAICSTEFLVLRPRPPFGTAYVYCLARSRSFRRAIESLVTGTSKSHQRAQVGALLQLQVVIPTSACVKAFERFAGPLLERALGYRREIRTLTALRDALLPKLISGELRVTDAERFVAE